MWARANLFSSTGSGLTTVALVGLALWLLPSMILWATTQAVWAAPDGALCRQHQDGACWAFIAAKLDYLRFGSYPIEERWRVTSRRSSRSMLDRVAALAEGSASRMERAALFRCLSRPGLSSSAGFSSARFAHRRHAALGRDLRILANGSFWDRLFVALGRPAGARSAIEDAGCQIGVRHFHRVRSGSAVHNYPVHGQYHAASLFPRGLGT